MSFLVKTKIYFKRSNRRQIPLSACLNARPRQQSLYNGIGYIAGEDEGIVTVNGEPAVRRVYLFDCKTLKLCRAEWSSPDGHYCLPHLDPNRTYLVIARDHLGDYEPVAYDHVKPALPS